MDQAATTTTTRSHRVRYLTKAEIDAALPKLRYPYNLCALFQWRAGLRVSEAINVTPRDVDLEAGILTVQDGKGHKQRSVPIHPQLRQMLAIAPKPNLDRPYVGRDRSRVTRHYKRAGIQGTHILRHSFSRHVQANPRINLAMASNMLGHSHITTTANMYSSVVSVSPELMDEIE